MQPETGDVRTSLNNVRKLLKCRTVARLIHLDEGTLIVFEDGSVHHALGLQAGGDDLRSRALGQIAAEIYGVRPGAAKRHYAGMVVHPGQELVPPIGALRCPPPAP